MRRSNEVNDRTWRMMVGGARINTAPKLVVSAQPNARRRRKQFRGVQRMPDENFGTRILALRDIGFSWLMPKSSPHTATATAVRFVVLLSITTNNPSYAFPPIPYPESPPAPIHATSPTPPQSCVLRKWTSSELLITDRRGGYPEESVSELVPCLKEK